MKPVKSIEINTNMYFCLSFFINKICGCLGWGVGRLRRKSIILCFNTTLNNNLLATYSLWIATFNFYRSPCLSGLALKQIIHSDFKLVLISFFSGSAFFFFGNIFCNTEVKKRPRCIQVGKAADIPMIRPKYIFLAFSRPVGSWIA